jgi:signal transduction histidine kinase
MLAYSYLKLVGEAYPLVSIGLISFCAIAQFAPTVLGALYWKRATKTGAVWGLTTGLLLWAYTLPLPTLAEVGLIPATAVEGGLLGIPWLDPYALFGMNSLGPVAHSAFWSLTLNTLFYVLGSLVSRPGRSEVAQADFFVDVYKYAKIRSEREVMRRQARMHDIRLLLNRFLGEDRTEAILQDYARQSEKPLKNQVIAQPDLVNRAEVQLAGTIGAASARVLMSSIAREDPISLEEMLEVLEQTQEIVAYSKALEQKSGELERTTEQLRAANEQLKELDRLKADFITTVTHELRTPITSIKTIARILQDHSQRMEEAKYREFLEIMVSESERIGRLINQVLDLEKIQSPDREYQWEMLVLEELVNRARMGVQQLIDQKNIELNWRVEGELLLVRGDYDKLTQVIVNLLSNAVKFCPEQNGRIQLQVQAQPDSCLVVVKDNGIGISAKDQAVIFDKFTQLTDKAHGKPAGSGLGLHISRIIVEHHGGEIGVESSPGNGAAFYIRLPRIQKAGEKLSTTP